MALQTQYARLETNCAVLKQQMSLTFESWDDPLRRKYEQEYIEPFFKEFVIFMEALSKLDASLKAAEERIHELS